MLHTTHIEVIYHLVTTQFAQKIISAVSSVFQKAIVNPMYSFNAVTCGSYIDEIAQEARANVHKTLGTASNTEMTLERSASLCTGLSNGEPLLLQRTR